MTSEQYNRIFRESIDNYHVKDTVDTLIRNPYPAGALEHLLYAKNWIDTVQWHLEDIIRDPSIDPLTALQVKRRIDHSNQQRTDIVEYIDSWFLKEFSTVVVLPEATFNTESPAWAIDRLSILALKIYHMNIESNRLTGSEAHRRDCSNKLDLLLQQQRDLSLAIDLLLEDIAACRKFMKVYRQMKMYNDEGLNPVLYSQKE